MTPTDTVLNALTAAKREPRKSGSGWAARCPAHEDKSPSLSIGTGDNGGAVLHCQAGCTPDAVVEALGLTMRDLFPEDRAKPGRPAPRRWAKPAATDPAAEPAAAALDEDPERWVATFAPLAEAMTPDRWATLAATLALPVEACRRLSVGWADGAALKGLNPGKPGPRTGAWAIPEVDGGGGVVGLSLRSKRGSKWAATGGKRGLTLAEDPPEAAGPVLLVEGQSDTAAAAALGLRAIGRPSCTGGVDALAELLAAETGVLVLGERDEKPNGAWPGRDGARATAEKLAAAWGRPVRWSLVPEGSKDLRAGCIGLPPDDPAAWAARGAELLAAIEAAAETAEPPPGAAGGDEAEGDAKPPTRSQADRVVELAGRLYRVGRTADGEPFAVRRDAPSIALPLRGGRSGLRASLAAAFRAEAGKVAAGAALADALMALEGEAMDATPEPVELRVAESGREATGGRAPGRVVLDFGTADGAAAVIEPGAWRVETPGPVLFRRTGLTGEHRRPETGVEPEALLELRDLLNVTDETWPLVVAWLVAALVPALDHPVVLMGGEQGTGKSTAARFLVELVDPSPAALRTQPRDPEGWATMAGAAWCSVVDNVSSIPAWWSDALCKASTGDGFVKRALYTDEGLVVKAFRRCVLLTSIDAGALAGDLGSRLLLLDLEPIDPAQRLELGELEHRRAAAAPRLLGALLTTTARTLAKMPTVKLPDLPRLADFCRVAAALDAAAPEVTGGRALAAYLEQAERIADDVVQADPVAAAVLALMEWRPKWSGTAAELLAVLHPRDANGDEKRPPRGWPDTPQKLGSAIKRTAPALRRLGIAHDLVKSGDRRHTFQKVAD